MTTPTGTMRQSLRNSNDLEHRLELARAAVARVVALHTSYASPRGPECLECLMPFPCRTRQALAGDGDDMAMARGPAGALREPVKPVRCLRCRRTTGACVCHEEAARHG